MKSKNLFLVILFITISIILLCIWIHNNKHLKSLNIELNGSKNKIIYEPIPISIKKTVSEAQKEINSLLIDYPIKFLDKSFVLENNKTINDIVSILNQTIGDISIKVASHSDSNQTASYNRKLTQKRADNIASYIENRYNSKIITAIGYGKEFPLPKEDNRTNNRIEIYLRRINNDF